MARCYYAAAVNPNGIKTISAIGLITLFINDKPFFRNGPKCLPGNLPNYNMLDNRVFDNLV